MNIIIEKFKKRELSLADEEDWPLEADKASNRFREIKERERFWKEILRYALDKEREKSKHYHKGHIYLRLAIAKLLLGKSYHTVFNYLKLAQKEVEQRRYRDIRGRPPKDYTSNRFYQILSCFLRYKNSHSRNRRIIDAHLGNVNERKFVHYTFCIIYNLSLESAYMKCLGWSHFDKLLGRNKYRVRVESQYRGALWLYRRINEIHRRTNLEQYGLASAMITLCGATIEGILIKNQKLLNTPPIRKNSNKSSLTLGKYIWSYIDYLNPPPDLTAMFVFLLSIRNQIHPKNPNNRFILVDMILAKFVFRLTERIIMMLSNSSRKRKRF